MVDQRVTPRQNVLIFFGTGLWLAWLGWLISPAFISHGMESRIVIKNTGSFCGPSSSNELKPNYPLIKNSSAQVHPAIH